ncbi:dienelactone hydrolase family protein [Rossellomorea aquimaris]|uniref:dienelactone hydrolase family protein n=1 Tax=Rossellomorea aquimaris TaxID=189382 RepID=UPI0024943D33|nr:dienelactone hydrolase family protein [Rossellomorea aquimaris]
MIQIHNQSDTLMMVIHEIYGINQHMQGFCERVSRQRFDVICPNFLERNTPFNYSEEKEAYHHFMENVGFTDPLYKIKDIISEVKDEYQRIFIIGFSVGATIAWLCSEGEHINGVVGYYGSRIRNYVEITPKCPTKLFFPQEEQSFNVDQLISTLHIKNIDVHKLNGKHGFSNPYSSNYNDLSAQKAFSEMIEFIMRH